MSQSFTWNPFNALMPIKYGPFLLPSANGIVINGYSPCVFISESKKTTDNSQTDTTKRTWAEEYYIKKKE